MIRRLARPGRVSGRAVVFSIWFLSLAALLGGARVAGASDGAAGADYTSALVERAHAANLAASREWMVLGHYRDNRLSSGVTSEVDAAEFFLAADGKIDPAAELDATLAAFVAEALDLDQSSEGGHEPARCRFPARFAWLGERLHFDPALLPRAPCERFDHWRAAIGAESATIIFASAYPNGPSSMFGHTLVRLNRAREGDAADLLAYAVNYAALPTTENPILYTFMGLGGGFPGYFATMPYYLKVQEYADMEDRDIWEYRLGLEPARVARLVEHLWELGHAWFDYYYLSENCSYHLLAVLDVADPSLHLTDEFQKWVIPGDTVKAIVERAGLVVSTRFRPSRFRGMVARRETLAASEVTLAERLADPEGGEPRALLEAAESTRRAAILDTAYELVRYRAEASPMTAAKGRERELLMARGQLAFTAQPAEVPVPPTPESSHGSAAITLGGGYGTRGGFADLAVRGALHDLLDPAAGYMPGNQIEMFGLEARLFGQEAPAFELERAFLARIVSLAPVDPWVIRPSWHVYVGLDRVREDACAGWDCVFGSLSGGAGLALGWERWVPGFTYGFADLDVGAGAPFRDAYRIQAGASLGALLTPLSAWRVQLEAGYLYPFLGVATPDSFDDGGEDGVNYRLLGATSLSLTHDLELRAEATKLRGAYEGMLSLRWYR